MGYIGQAPGLGIKRDFLFYATAGQTSFSGVDANGMTLLLNPRTVIVYVNGVRVLKGVDYTVPNVSTIVFVSGLEALDEVAVDNFEAFSPANTYDKNEADTLLAKKLSVNLPQTFTELEKGQGRANIGADLLAGFRNVIINGDASVATRYDGLTITGTKYAFDRWELSASGVSTTPSILSTTVGSEVNGSSSYFSISRASGGGTTFFLQKMEAAILRRLSGKKVTVTFWESIDAGKSIEVRLDQQFGSGGSTATNTSVKTVVGTGSWVKHSVAVDLPSIAGKTLGTTPTLQLIFRWDGSGGAGVLRFTRISIVEGDATAEGDPFSPRAYPQELALCQRFYQFLPLPGALLDGNAPIAGTYVTNYLSLLVPLRTSSPTIVAVWDTGQESNVTSKSVRATNSTIVLEIRSVTSNRFYATPLSVSLDAEI